MVSKCIMTVVTICPPFHVDKHSLLKAYELHPSKCVLVLSVPEKWKQSLSRKLRINIQQFSKYHQACWFSPRVVLHVSDKTLNSLETKGSKAASNAFGHSSWGKCPHPDIATNLELGSFDAKA